jgi:hypothetical protein
MLASDGKWRIREEAGSLEKGTVKRPFCVSLLVLGSDKAYEKDRNSKK